MGMTPINNPLNNIYSKAKMNVPTPTFNPYSYLFAYCYYYNYY